MNAPRKSKTVNDELELAKSIDADFQHEYYEAEHLESVPSIIEGLGYDLE